MTNVHIDSSGEVEKKKICWMNVQKYRKRVQGDWISNKTPTSRGRFFQTEFCDWEKKKGGALIAVFSSWTSDS